jgi:hypothetical protein
MENEPMSSKRLDRPNLMPYSLAAAMAAMTGHRPGALIITMSIGQWDTMLAVAYEQGWLLVELDDDEMPVRAYRKPEAAGGATSAPDA